MMRSMLLWMKRWWVLALVVTLALSLTSCSRRRSLQTYQGYEECSGSLGSFDAYVIPARGNPGMYEVSLIPTSVTPYDIARVVVLNQQLSYRLMVDQVILQPEEQIFVGYLSEAEINQYDSIAIIPWDANQLNLTPIEQNNEKDTVCALPLPGNKNSSGLSNAAP